MKITQLVGPAPDWRDQSWAARMDDAASALYVHGYITQSQRAKITEKIERQFREGIASGAIVERRPTDAPAHQGDAA